MAEPPSGDVAHGYSLLENGSDYTSEFQLEEDAAEARRRNQRLNRLKTLFDINFPPTVGKRKVNRRTSIASMVNRAVLQQAGFSPQALDGGFGGIGDDVELEEPTSALPESPRLIGVRPECPSDASSCIDVAEVQYCML